MQDDVSAFLSTLHPYNQMPVSVCKTIASQVTPVAVAAGNPVYDLGAPLDGIYIILDGQISVLDRSGMPVSLLERGNSFGERGLLRDGVAVTSVRAETDANLLCLPAPLFHRLMSTQEPFRRFFERGSGEGVAAQQRPFDLGSVRVDSLMIANPMTCTPETPVSQAAAKMKEHGISCLCVTKDGALVGILTLRDMVFKALAGGNDPKSPVSQFMTENPRTLAPTSIGSDVLHTMLEHRLGHLPIVAAGKLVGIVTQTDLTRFQASNAASFVKDAARAKTPEALIAITARIPNLLVQLVAAGHRHDVVTRSITDIADVVTRSLLRQAEDRFGPPPVRYLWLACGSQGRQEQTGVSDQDNCLILEDGVDADGLAYFRDLAQYVSDGLHGCGYVYCPGDMMATNPRWCQPVSVWRDYFAGWVASPSKEAQMLASVMFDLRPIGGDETLFTGLQQETLRAASGDWIFTAHMASNALTHASTADGMLRGFATIRSGEHRNTIDLKLNGVVPVVDLGRMYALQGKLEVVNTRARLEAALKAKLISSSGGRDLLDAYDLVAQTRLEHQAGLIKQGKAPDNFLPPAVLSDFDRSHLRDAFVVIKTMQSALMQGRGVLG